MEDQQMEDLKYPIGKFSEPAHIDQALIKSCIADIASFPEKLKKVVENLSGKQLDTAYRPQGWTIRQVVHHCADSHMNSWIRFKLILTETKPVIKPYYEDRWADLPDSKIMDIEPALLLLRGLHTKWVFLLQSLTKTDLEKVFVHPEHGKEYSLDVVITLYAWHCNHHLAHITSLKSRKGWN